MKLPTTGAAASSASESHTAAMDSTHYVLRLYVTCSTPNSIRAISNIRMICQAHLHGRYELDIIDISTSPVFAGGEQIIAAPTLIKKLPLPLRRFIGDMLQTGRILLGLDIRNPNEIAPPLTDS